MHKNWLFLCPLFCSLTLSINISHTFLLGFPSLFLIQFLDWYDNDGIKMDIWPWHLFLKKLFNIPPYYKNKIKAFKCVVFMTRPLPASPFPFLAHSHPGLYPFNTQLYTVWGHVSIMSHGLFLCLECQPPSGPLSLRLTQPTPPHIPVKQFQRLILQKGSLEFSIVLTTPLKLPR